jgi:predicted phosphate transport protein (TIGR00153 family)
MLCPALRFLDPRRQDYLPGLLDHYQPIGRGMALLDEALKRSLADGQDLGFKVLAGEIDILEAEADKIKRRIRNHLPSAFFMVVDKTLFLNYTRNQDNILDAVQEAVAWLGLGSFTIPPELGAAMAESVAQAGLTVAMLRPALTDTIDFVLNGRSDRGEVKSRMHELRLQHLKVVRAKRGLISAAYASGLDFSRVYQIIRFVEYVYRASHSAEACADLLRAMLAR